MSAFALLLGDRRTSSAVAALLERPQPVRFVLVGIVRRRRRDQLRAFPAEVIETTPERLAKISARAPSLQPIVCLIAAPPSPLFTPATFEWSRARSSGSCEARRKRGDRATAPIAQIWRKQIRGCSCRGHASVSDARSYHRARRSSSN